MLAAETEKPTILLSKKIKLQQPVFLGWFFFVANSRFPFQVLDPKAIFASIKTSFRWSLL